MKFKELKLEIILEVMIFLIWEYLKIYIFATNRWKITFVIALHS